MRRPVAATLLVSMFSVLAASRLDAQIAAPRARGVAVPRAYFDRVARDPHAFTLPNGLFAVAADGAQRVPRALGNKRIIVIPALFADSPEPSVSSQDITQVLFTGPAPQGTFTDAYLEMSRGKLRMDGDVAPWVRTSLTLQQAVGTQSGLGDDARVGEYLTEALALEDPGIDFGLYDNDGPDGIPNSGDDNGFVDAITFEFTEVAGSCGGPGIWPHMYGISAWPPNQPYVTDDLRPDGSHVMVDAYVVESALDCTGTAIQSAGTMAHEFGHVLGLPDYYHPTGTGVGAEGRRWVLGCWELMAAGSWGCGPVGSSRASFGPTHMSAYPKHELGWVDYVDVTNDVRDEQYVLEPMETTGQPLRIPLDATGNEFLLLEYRTRTGFDVDLPADGVLIYHQDFQGNLRPPEGSGQPYFLAVVEQDHNNGLQRTSFEGGNRGEAGDAWGVGGMEQKLDFLTTPSLRLDDGGATSVTIHSVVAQGDRAVIRLSTAITPTIAAPDTAPVTKVIPFEQRMRIAGGYMPYTVEGAAPAGVTLKADGDDAVVAGSLSGDGPFDVALRVVDSRGVASPLLFYSLTAEEWLAGEDRLVQSFLRSDAQPLSAAEMVYLDDAGNGNGVYDVGDLRAWLRAHPPGPAAVPGR